MRLTEITIQNFRGFDYETIPLDNFTCLVGPNGGGKSTVLQALNVFFKNGISRLSKEDFHHGNISEPAIVTLTFGDLDQAEEEDFGHYYRQGKLIVSAVSNMRDGEESAEIKHFGKRLVMKDLSPFFDAYDNKALKAKLSELYNVIREQYSDLPTPGTKEEMRGALRDYEDNHPEKCIVSDSEDQFYGGGKGRLEKYVQWVYVPAVKDASGEQLEARNTALGALLERTVRSKMNFGAQIDKLKDDARNGYRKLLTDSQAALSEISGSLQRRITQWARPGVSLKLEWREDPDQSVQIKVPLAHVIAGEGGFEGAIARFGHGLQRSYLLALLQELAESEDLTDARLLLGCEEPELYQHPPQARHLAGVLESLSMLNSQVLITTHSPLFVSGKGFECIRLVRSSGTPSFSRSTNLDYGDVAKSYSEAVEEPMSPREAALAKVHQALQPGLNEMFFTNQLILVEGLEDLAFLTTYFSLMGLMDRFREVGCHIVPTHGKSDMIKAVIIAKRLNIPTYILFDSDSDDLENGRNCQQIIRENRALLSLTDNADINPKSNVTVVRENMAYLAPELGSVVVGEIGKDPWEAHRAEADRIHGGARHMSKNMLYVGTCLGLAWGAERKSETLEQICRTIVGESFSNSKGE